VARVVSIQLKLKLISFVLLLDYTISESNVVKLYLKMKLLILKAVEKRKRQRESVEQAILG
jgi:hypothetical protein